MMFADSLQKATSQLLTAVKAVTAAMEEKKQIIRDCEVAIKEAQSAVAEAKETLKL